MARTLVSRRYIAVTLLVLAAMAVMARLGVWQLERREQRQARNVDLALKLSQPPLSVNAVAAGLATLPDQREAVRNLRASATGRFDYANQVLLVQQVHNDMLGSRLLTPLLLAESDKAILVDRGWIPTTSADPSGWAQYDGEARETTLPGFLLPTQIIGAPAQPDPNQPARREWFQADVAAIAAQLPYEVLPVYLLQAASPQDNAAPPLRQDPVIDLSEGPHLGYAIQWFSFAVVAGVVYLRVVWQRERKAQRAVVRDEEPDAASGIQHV